MTRLFIFNPEHDIALANGSEFYQAPESALKLRRDLAALPKWYANEEFDCTVVSLNDLNLFLNTGGDYTLVPWGWNRALLYALKQHHIPSHLFPSEDQLTLIRDCSHRRFAASIAAELKQKLNLNSLLIAEEITSEKELELFAQRHDEFVLKAPWSSSGKGLFWGKAPLSASLTGWAKRIIRGQGSVMGEKAYEKHTDFAMEFLAENGKVTFAGYSIFFTEGKGVYTSSWLSSNEQMELYLSNQIELQLIHAIKDHLETMLTKTIGTFYSGYLGVDMFTYLEKDQLEINPCVEVNLRMTMGMVARLFYDLHVDEHSEGRFYIDRAQIPEELLEDHVKRSKEQPQTWLDSRLLSGYLSLCPIEAHTNYRVRVELTNTKK